MNDARDVIVLGEGEGEPVWFLDHFCTLKVRKGDGAPYGLLEVRLPNLIVTPHIAWATLEARQRLMKIAGDNLEAFIAGNPVNVVN